MGIRTSTRYNQQHPCTWAHPICTRKRNFSASFFLSLISHWLAFVCSGINLPSLLGCLTGSLGSVWGTHVPVPQQASSCLFTGDGGTSKDRGWWDMNSGGCARAQPSLEEAKRAGRGRVPGDSNGSWDCHRASEETTGWGEERHAHWVLHTLRVFSSFSSDFTSLLFGEASHTLPEMLGASRADTQLFVLFSFQHFPTISTVLFTFVFLCLLE